MITTYNAQSYEFEVNTINSLQMLIEDPLWNVHLTTDRQNNKVIDLLSVNGTKTSNATLHVL